MENWDKVERLVASLMENETVEADEVRAIIEGRPHDRGDTTSGGNAAVTEPPPIPVIEEKRPEPGRLPPTISPEPA